MPRSEPGSDPARQPGAGMDVPRFNAYWQYVDYWASRTPDLRSLRDDSRMITAAEFADLTDQIAMALLGMGVRKGDRVATILPAGIDYILTMIAVEKAGAALVPLDIKFRPAELNRFLGHTTPKVLISVSEADDFDVAEAVASLARDHESMQVVFTGKSETGVPFESLLEGGTGEERRLESAKKAQEPDDGWLVIFTGGTTGQPKAALLSRRNTASMSHIEAERLLAANGIENGSAWPVFLPPSHAGGTVEIIGMGIVGGHEMIMAAPWSPREYLELAQREGVEFLAGVPTMLAIILALPDLEVFDLSSVKVVLMSGEKVPLELVRGVKERICDRVICGYGSTEAGAEVCITTADDEIEEIARGYVGTSLPGVEARIVNDAGRSLPLGETGEIVVGGPYAISSYFEMPDEDAAGFTANGLVRTGDLGHMTPEGGLYITGRKKHIIRVGSYTVLPTEVEEVALEHPGVALAAAMGVPDSILGEKVRLFVALGEGSDVTADDLMARCREMLAKFKVPDRVIVRNDLPMTRVGKVDRAALNREILEALEAGEE